MNEYVGTQMRGWGRRNLPHSQRDPTMRSTVIALTVLEQALEWERLRRRRTP